MRYIRIVFFSCLFVHRLGHLRGWWSTRVVPRFPCTHILFIFVSPLLLYCIFHPDMDILCVSFNNLSWQITMFLCHSHNGLSRHTSSNHLRTRNIPRNKCNYIVKESTLYIYLSFKHGFKHLFIIIIIIIVIIIIYTNSVKLYLKFPINARLTYTTINIIKALKYFKY